MKRVIQPGLALAIAGQVGAGLARGDAEGERARMALVAIGLMIRTADGSELVEVALQMSEKTRITELPGGGWRIEPKDADE